MKPVEDEASSECVSNVQPSNGLGCRHRRNFNELCSPCASTEPTASKFDGRGCRGRFLNAPEAGFRTPLPMCQSADLAGAQPQPISAELLLTAQEKLREAYQPRMMAQPLTTGALLPSQAANVSAQPFSSYATPFEAMMMPPVLEMHGVDGTCIAAPEGIATSGLRTPGCVSVTELHATAAALDTAAASLARLEKAAPDHSERRRKLEESDEDTLSSSSSSSGSKKRKRHAALYAKMQQDSWAAAELALQWQQLQARVAQLEGYNAHLIRQLSATLRTLSSERAVSQAEITRQRQKCAALAAFLPPSVAAFALDSPPEIALNSRAALLRAHSGP